MTDAQKAFKKSLIQQVHTAPKYRLYYKENREDYEKKLFDHFGQKSSKVLNIEQLLALVRWLHNELPELPVIKDRSKEATDRQRKAILKLWDLYARDTSETALRQFVKKLTGNTYLHIDKMNKADATKVILALKKTLKEL